MSADGCLLGPGVLEVGLWGTPVRLSMCWRLMKSFIEGPQVSKKQVKTRNFIVVMFVFCVFACHDVSLMRAWHKS